MKLSNESVAEASALAAEMFADLEARQGGVGSTGDQSHEIGFDMRYVGQEHWLSVPVRSENGTVASSADEVRESFVKEYERTFRSTMDEDAEIVSVRATLRKPLPRREQAEMMASAAEKGEAGTFEAYSFTAERSMAFAVIDRGSLKQGAVLDGPAIITEETATAYLDAGYVAKVGEMGCLFVTRTESKS